MFIPTILNYVASDIYYVRSDILFITYTHYKQNAPTPADAPSQLSLLEYKYNSSTKSHNVRFPASLATIYSLFKINLFIIFFRFGKHYFPAMSMY